MFACVFSGNCCTTSHSMPVMNIVAAELRIMWIGIWISKIDNYRFERRKAGLWGHLTL